MIYTNDYLSDIELVLQSLKNSERLFDKTVLITGATGMIGSSVTEILAVMNRRAKANIKLILAGRSERRIRQRFKGILKNTDYEYLFFDATQSDKLDLKADFIIYGANNANPSAYAKEPAETLLANIIGLHTMLELCKKNSGSRLLYLSSSEVYGKRIDGKNIPYEEGDYGYVDILNPRACYPNGKRAAETLCSCYLQEYGVDSVIVRPCHIYGPTIMKGDAKASSAFTRDVLQKKDIVMKSAGTQIRSYCYTMDCASAILTVLLHGNSGNAYNISNKNSIVTIRDLAETMAQYGGVNVVFENPSDQEKRGYNLMSNSSLDSRRLEELGWVPLFDLNTGVKRTIDILKEENELL